MFEIPDSRCATTLADAVMADANALFVGSAAYFPIVLKKSVIAELSPADLSAITLSIIDTYCVKVSEFVDLAC